MVVPHTSKYLEKCVQAGCTWISKLLGLIMVVSLRGRPFYNLGEGGGGGGYAF